MILSNITNHSVMVIILITMTITPKIITMIIINDKNCNLAKNNLSFVQLPRLFSSKISVIQQSAGGGKALNANINRVY